MSLKINPVKSSVTVKALHRDYTDYTEPSQLLHRMNARNDHRYSVKVIVRSDSIRKDGRASLAIQTFINGQRKVIGLGCLVDPVSFNSTKQYVSPPEGASNEDRESIEMINALIHKSKSRAEQIFYKAILDDKPLTSDRFADIFLSTASKNNFYQFIEDEMAKNKDVKEGSTLLNDKKVLNRLKEYKPTLLMHEINYDFVDGFHRFLKRKKYAPNTIWGYHKGLKAFINVAIKREHRIGQPYKDFKISKAKTERVFLELHEVQKLLQAYRNGALGERLNRTARIFLFTCFTGLRNQDVHALTDENIVYDSLVFRPKKTKNSRMILKIPLSDHARTIVEDARRTHSDKTLFKAMTLKTVNKTLKEVGSIVGIGDKKITSHIGRHTFAAMFLMRGGNVEVLQQILGHSDIRTTMVYVHVTATQKQSMIKKIDEYFTGHLAQLS